MSTYQFGDETSSSSLSSKFTEHTTVSNQERKLQAMTNRIEKNNGAVEDKIKVHTQQLKEKGIFSCNERDSFGSYCTFRAWTEEGVQLHQEKGCCHFAKHDVATRAVAKARDQGFCSLQFGIGSMPNISDAHASRVQVQTKPLKPCKEVETSWFQDGCYRTASRRSTKKKSYALLCDLEMMYRAGESRSADNTEQPSASKYTPEKALAYLFNMKDATSKRRKYRIGGEYGILPTLSAVRSWFSGRSSGSIPPVNLTLDKYESSAASDLKVMCI